MRERLADFRRKFWLWVYKQAGNRLRLEDVAEFWDGHWRRWVAYRLYQVEERYGQEVVRFIITDPDADTQDRDYRDPHREIRIR